MIKGILFDIDDTLFSHETEQVPRQTLKALDKLKEKGYKLISAQAADLFPRCAHVESIVCLCKQ